MSQKHSNDGYERISYDTRQRFWDALESPQIVHLVLIFAVFMIVMPIVWELITSLKTNEAIYNLTYLPRNPTLQSYYQVLFEQNFYKALINSAIISTTTTVVVMVLAVPAGYAFSRYRFPFDNLIFVGVIFSRLFPPIGLVVPYYEVMNTFNLVNTETGIIIAEIYLWLPLMIYIMRNFFISIPEDLDESARVDGCTRFQAFRLIALPLARPGIAACAILTFLYTWREFLFALVISSTLKAQPISVAVYNFVGDVSVRWASLAAAAILAVVPTIAIVLFFQQYIVSGLTAGALKE